MNSPAPTPAPVQTALTPAVFLALSSGLTGVSTAQLQPARAPLDVARLFYDAVCESVPPEILRRIAQTFLATNTVTEGAAEVLIDPELAPVGRNLVRLWLTGLWHDPHVPSNPPRIICDDAYRQCSVWRIMQAAR